MDVRTLLRPDNDLMNFEGRGGIGLRGAGHADVSAARTVRRLT
jgi:hypothetical protein